MCDWGVALTGAPASPRTIWPCTSSASPPTAQDGLSCGRMWVRWRPGPSGSTAAHGLWHSLWGSCGGESWGWTWRHFMPWQGHNWAESVPMICLHYPRWGFQREAVVTHCSLTSRDPPPPRDLSHTNGGTPRPAQAWSAWVQLRLLLFRVACGTDGIRGQKQSVGIFSDPILGREGLPHVFSDQGPSCFLPFSPQAHSDFHPLFFHGPIPAHSSVCPWFPEHPTPTFPWKFNSSFYCLPCVCYMNVRCKNCMTPYFPFYLKSNNNFLIPNI